MEKNNLYKTFSLNSFNENISIPQTSLSPKIYNNSQTFFNKKNKKLNIFNKTSGKFSKLSKFNNSMSTTNYKFPKFATSRVFHRNISYQKEPKKELSVAIFQNNDVELVRNLNPDSDKDLCSNMLLKEKLKNKIESNNNISLLFNSSKKNLEVQKPGLPKIKQISFDGILEDEKLIKNLKKELKQHKQSNLLEKDLNKKLKQINDISSLKKKNKIQIYDNFKKVLKEIDNVSYELQLLNQKTNDMNPQMRRDSKYNVIKGRRRSSLKINPNNNEYFINNKRSSKILTNNDLLELAKNAYNSKLLEKEGFNKISLIQTLYKEQKNKEFEKKVKQEKIFELKKELKQLKTPLKSINNEINELKGVEKSIKQRLMRHYQVLLYNGKEIRNEGLIWIIKAIWRLGENVPMSFMPTFLDFSAIKYLFRIARLSVELDSKKKFVLELKLKLKQQIVNFAKKKENENKNDNNNEMSINKSNISNENNKSSCNKKKKYFSNFKTDLLFKKNKLTKSSSQPEFMKTFINLNKKFNNNMNENIINNENEEEFKGTFKEMSKILEENENSLGFINSPAVSQIKNLEQKIKELELEIQNCKKIEIERIFKEFIDYDYENKYHTTIDIVLGALIGEHSRNIQVNKFNVFKKGYFDEIKNIRFYEYAKRNGWIS